MSALYNSTCAQINNYENQIPKNTPIQTVKSFACCFTASVIATVIATEGDIIRGALKRAVISGVVGSTMTIVNGLISPMFDQNRKLTALEAFGRDMVASTAGAVLATAVLGNSVWVKNLPNVVLCKMIKHRYFDIDNDATQTAWHLI